jgi:CPA2 family monovalent cation:H+ antiporter-2
VETTAPAIAELGLVLLVAAGAGWVARRLGLPAVVGYLAVGLAISPFTPGYIADRHQLQLFADLGVVLLLFEVGIEVDLGRLRREHGPLLWLAPLQLVASTAVVAAAALILGLPPFGAAIVGLGVAMSSSVVVVNITRSRRRTTDPATDRALLGWSVLQDVGGVLLAVAVLTAGGAGDRPLPLAVGGLIGALAIVLAAAVIVPLVLRRLRADHDLFLIVSVASGLAVAAVASIVGGIPMALAAFAAGLAITESPDAAEARRRLLPFRDLLAVLFFVVIGSLIDPGILGDAAPWLAFFLVAVIVAKVGLVYLLATVTRMEARPRQLAIGLGQIGEFSFVLASVAAAQGAIDRQVYVALLAAVVVTILGSTILVRLAGSRPLGDSGLPEAA